MSEDWRGDYAHVGHVVGVVQNVEGVQSHGDDFLLLGAFAKFEIMRDVQVKVDESRPLHRAPAISERAVVDHAVVVVVHAGRHVHRFIGIR